MQAIAQRRMAEALPEIVERFVTEAKLGSIAHAKALVALGGLDGLRRCEGEVCPERRRQAREPNGAADGGAEARCDAAVEDPAAGSGEAEG